jgi:hypothetical protein
LPIAALIARGIASCVVPSSTVLVVSDSSELKELTIWPAALRPSALESTQSAAAARTSLLMSTDGSDTASSMSSWV